MKIEPITMAAEIKIRDQWWIVEERLRFSEHERNAAMVGATEVRSMDGMLHTFLNSPGVER